MLRAHKQARETDCNCTNTYHHTGVFGLLATNPQITFRGQSLLSCRGSEQSQNTTIQQNLTQLEVYPEPEEKSLECTEGGDEGEDVDGEQLRDARFDVRQLCKAACELCEHIHNNADVRIQSKQPKEPGRQLFSSGIG